MSGRAFLRKFSLGGRAESREMPLSGREEPSAAREGPGAQEDTLHASAEESTAGVEEGGRHEPVNPPPPRRADTGWVLTWGGGSYDRASSVALSPERDIYVAGHFSGETDIDPGRRVDQRFSNGATDIFLMKYDAAGDLIWAKTWGSPGSDHGSVIAVDSEGDIVLSGNFKDSFELGDGADVVTIKACNQWPDTFLSKFNPDGNLVWAHPSIGGHRMALDGNNDIWIVGSKTDNRGGGYTYERKVTSNGNLAFERRQTLLASPLEDWIASSLEDVCDGYPNSSAERTAEYWFRICGGVAVDAGGNVLIAHPFSGTQDFDPGPEVEQRIVRVRIRCSSGGADAPCAEYD
jgi:hypothetical protein